MKHYLVTGAHGWLASELERRLAAFPGEYQLDKGSVRGNGWKEQDWSVYDGIFHFASVIYGNNAEEVNPALASSVAKKAVTDGVSWLLYLSSFSVYGAEAIPDALIDENSEVAPSNAYGRSKLGAEEAMQIAVEGSNTKLSVVRAPLIYGSRQKQGNFNALIKLAAKAPFFPETKNKRSMIYSQNLCELCRLLADAKAEGVFLPQDEAYYDTATLVKKLGEIQGKKVRIVPALSGLCHATVKISPKFGKLFGNARYAMEASNMGFDYRVATMEQSLLETVNGGVNNAS